MSHMADDENIVRMTDRLRKLRAGQSYIVDLRGLPDPIDVANEAMLLATAANRDVDQFVIDAAQEFALTGTIGQMETMLGYPVKVVYDIAED